MGEDESAGEEGEALLPDIEGELSDFWVKEIYLLPLLPRPHNSKDTVLEMLPAEDLRLLIFWLASFSSKIHSTSFTFFFNFSS